jgi:hypothetical protein
VSLCVLQGCSRPAGLHSYFSKEKIFFGHIFGLKFACLCAWVDLEILKEKYCMSSL